MPSNACVNIFRALTNLNTQMAEAKEKSNEVKNALNELMNASDFPTKRDTASEALSGLVSAVNDLPVMMGDAGINLKQGIFQILEGYVSNDYPVTQEGLGKLQDETIRCDSLVQPRYLDPYYFATNVRGHVEDDLSVVSMEEISRYNPEDMYATSILTRTTLYLQELRAKEEEEWFYSATDILAQYASRIEDKVSDLQNILEAIGSKEFEALAIKTIDNPATEVTFASGVTQMLECVKNVDKCLAYTQGMIDFYLDVEKLLEDTEPAILEAYQLYCKSNQISF